MKSRLKAPRRQAAAGAAKITLQAAPRGVPKWASGIEGFDDMTGGGLPRERTTVIMGGPGCGKTVFALQTLVFGAQEHGRSGIFVAFEEEVARVVVNAESFGWSVRALQEKKLFFVEASIRAEVVKAGAFDLTGLLAALTAQVRKMGATVIVFDAIDVLLNLLNDRAAEHRELRRLHEWLSDHRLTGILTLKIEGDQSPAAQRYGFVSFMADCAIILSQQIEDRFAGRTMRLLKYRGSAHVMNEVPFVIGSNGLEVASNNRFEPEPQPFEERVSTGVPRLDAMMQGGFYRGTNALITGSAGSGKSTLTGAFIAAACLRDERALFISLDENSADIMRDLASVNLHLEPYVKSRLLRMESFRTESASSEEHFLRIKSLICEHRPSCVAIDPISSLVKAGGELAARQAAERLIHLCRHEKITAVFTGLLEGKAATYETTPLYSSCLADTWIQISYSLRDGERNRALTIIKSRGSKHSNQLRELVFSDSGITLADPYTAGGKVRLGTLRLEKEMAISAEQERLVQETNLKRREIELLQLDHDIRIKTAQQVLLTRNQELDRLTKTTSAQPVENQLRQDRAIRRRDSALVREQSAGETPDARRSRSNRKG